MSSAFIVEATRALAALLNRITNTVNSQSLVFTADDCAPYSACRQCAPWRSPDARHATFQSVRQDANNDRVLDALLEQDATQVRVKCEVFAKAYKDCWEGREAAAPMVASAFSRPSISEPEASQTPSSGTHHTPDVPSVTGFVSSLQQSQSRGWA